MSDRDGPEPYVIHSVHSGPETVQGAAAETTANSRPVMPARRNNLLPWAAALSP
jgi:hypothetical protein